jgi:hypothetical protein
MRNHVFAGSVGAIFAAILAAILLGGSILGSGAVAATHGTTAPHAVLAGSNSPEDIPWP